MCLSLSHGFSFVFKVAKCIKLIYIDGGLELKDNHWDPPEGQPDSIKVTEVFKPEAVSVDAEFSLLSFI